MTTEEKAKKLVEMANDNGGSDNISVIIIDPFAFENQLNFTYIKGNIYDQDWNAPWGEI